MQNVEIGVFRGLGVTQVHCQYQNHLIERIRLPIQR